MAQIVRPLGVRSKAVKLNNLALVRFLGDPNKNVLPFLGSFLPEVDRESEDLAAKARYLWQDTLEVLAEKAEITTETLLKAWVLVGTANKPTPPSELLPKPEPEKCESVARETGTPAPAPMMARSVETRETASQAPAHDPLALTSVDQFGTPKQFPRGHALHVAEVKQAAADPDYVVLQPAVSKALEDLSKADYDRFLDDVDTDILSPVEAQVTSAEPVLEDLDIEHDTYDTFADVFTEWPYAKVQAHRYYGPILVVGQISGKNQKGHQVYKGCQLDADSFGKIGCIAEYERKGVRDSTLKIRVLKLKKRYALKFWVNVDDPTRPKGQRDMEAMYRYFEVSMSVGLQEVDSLAYQALKNEVSAV